MCLFRGNPDFHMSSTVEHWESLCETTISKRLYSEQREKWLTWELRSGPISLELCTHERQRWEGGWGPWHMTKTSSTSAIKRRQLTCRSSKLKSPHVIILMNEGVCFHAE